MSKLKMKSSWILPSVLFAVFAIGFNNCVPQEVSQEEMYARQKAKRDSVMRANFARCEFKNSNAYQYKLQENWNVAIDNYRNVIELGCADTFYTTLFEDMAFCYYKLGMIDSAAWSVNQGLTYNNTNRHLLDLKAYYVKDNPEEQLAVYNQINTLYPDNLEILFNIAELYGKLGDLENQIEVLDKITVLDPGNVKAEQQMKVAYEQSGRDPIERVASLYMNDKANPSYTYEYSKMLFERGDYAKTIEILEEARGIHSGNRSIMELLAQAYEFEYRTDKAVEIYSDLARKYPSDQNLNLKVIKLLIEVEKYEDALALAEKAIQTTTQNGKAIAARGDVYYAVAEKCSGMNAKLDFNDKLVFHMAYEDYREAVAQGNSAVSGRLNYLKNPNNGMILATRTDYFLAGDANKVNSKTFKVLGDCYSWINRTVTVE